MKKSRREPAGFFVRVTEQENTQFLQQAHPLFRLQCKLPIRFARGIASQACNDSTACCKNRASGPGRTDACKKFQELTKTERPATHRPDATHKHNLQHT